MSDGTLTFAEVVVRENRTAQPECGDAGGGASEQVACMQSLGGGPVVTMARPATCESYAAAVKSGNVKLGGVPVNVCKSSGPESMTNSTIQEEESVLSSWADDDECFLSSVRNTLEKRSCELQSKDCHHHGNFRCGRGPHGWQFTSGNESHRSTNGAYNDGNGQRRRKKRNNIRLGVPNNPSDLAGLPAVPVGASVSGGSCAPFLTTNKDVSVA